MITRNNFYAMLVKLVFLSLMFTAQVSQASSFESLMMPGKLVDGHKKYEDDCSNCHSNFSKQSQSNLCIDCHEDIAKDVKGKRGFHGKNILALKQECKQCHTDHKGRGANIIPLDKQTFNHQHTDFELSGKHKQLSCNSCHLDNKKYREAKSTCYSCHKDDDPHNEKLGKKCQSCHNESSWKKLSFDHSKTDFPLKGKHKNTLCISCHPDNRHKKTPKQCYSCHALDDAHNTRYGKKCATCHSEKDWTKARFDHDKKTKYPLKGKHKKVQCDSCHTGNTNIYKKKPKKTCVSCHQSDDTHNGRNGKKCQSCHTTTSWRKNKFSHNRDTKFALKGRHAKLSCNTCHQGDLHKNKLKRDCLSCHKVDDVHKGQEGKQCNNCHTDTSWRSNIKFNHDITLFPLIGQHAIASCDECHSSQQFKDASPACYTCHKIDDKHEKTLGPNCHQCHNPNSWSSWLFDHNKQTNFTLKDSHKNLQCSACHTEPTNSDVNESSTCATCHFQDDKHRGGFGKNCEQCHNADKFSDLTL